MKEPAKDTKKVTNGENQEKRMTKTCVIFFVTAEKLSIHTLLEVSE